MRFLSFHLGRVLAIGVLAVVGRADSPLIGVPRYSHPALGQVTYFVMTDRFSDGDATNNYGDRSAAEGRFVHGFDPTDARFYHGGDFRGLTARLDYIQSLGASAIWVTPFFRNKTVQGTTAAYHGYWILDFLHVDPHLGTDADLRAFISAAHLRGLKVDADIVVNHTADVIGYTGGSYAYRSTGSFPYRDATAQVFDPRDYADNGLGVPPFPALDPAISFPYVPFVAAADAAAKNPDWLNDLTNYHNRGDSSYSGEDFQYGDISGLDDVFTEKPAVVQGFIDVYSHWVADYGLDGFRVDTAKHVNPEFWEAFCPAMSAVARAAGRNDFYQYGEVYNWDPHYLSDYSTREPFDATLDFAFEGAVRAFVSQAGAASALAGLFEQDDLYTTHHGNAYASATFIGNHDLGRFGGFVRQDNPTATDGQATSLVKMGYGLLLLARGQPIIYYGDEQGLAGRGGDAAARQDMGASQTATYAAETLIGTTATGASDKFNPNHPLYQAISALATLRRSSSALRSGAQVARPTSAANVFAFGRIDRSEQREWLVVFNNSRSADATVSIGTWQPGGAGFTRQFDSSADGSGSPASLVADANGQVSVRVGPLQFAAYEADRPLPARVAAPAVRFANLVDGATLEFAAQTYDGLTIPGRAELRVDVAEDTDAEVTFVMNRASRPGQWELLGVDDNAPYRLYFRPPADLAPGETLTFLATVDDLRGHQASAQVSGVKLGPSAVAFGVRGAVVPTILEAPKPKEAHLGDSLSLSVTAAGTAPLQYRWVHDGRDVTGATDAVLAIPAFAATDAGAYRAIVSNVAGSVLSATAEITSNPQPRITANPTATTVAAGAAVTFSATATGASAYQWQKDGVALAGATTSTLLLPAVSASAAGAYTLVATNAAGAVSSEPALLQVATPVAGRLFNLSIRSNAGQADETLIAGFGLTGVEPCPLVVRGIGPGLSPFGVPGVLMDPQLAVLRGSTVIAADNDWGGAAALATAFHEVGAFPLPTDSRDAALLVAPAPNSYTVEVTGADGGTGVALIEVYDASGGAATARLTNLSARTQVGQGANVLIAGFSLSGNVPKRLLIRGVGPGLAPFGVHGLLADPKLQLFDARQTVVAENDDWSDSPNDAAALATAFHEGGAFPLPAGSRDAALVRTVIPGGYTVQVSGVANTTGVAHVEVYELP